MSAKDSANEFMNKIKEENPDANWTNLLTGLAVILLIVVFSFWYFNRASQGDFLTEVEVEDGNGETVVEGENGQLSGEEDSPAANEVVVLEGEGLWQVAERVCGEGERYNFLADANNLTIFTAVTPGQRLIVACGN